MSDPLDILTLDEGKSAVGINVTDVSDDVELAAYITEVSRFLDSKIGATVARAVTNEIHHGCRGAIILRHRPVMSIGSLIEYTATAGLTLTASTTASQPSNGYYLEPYEPQAGLYSGIVVRYASGRPWRFAYGSANVVCSYTAGRVASTSTVDARIKHAAKVTLKNAWRDREQSAGQFNEFDVPIQNFPTFALPRFVSDLMSEEIGQDETWGIA